MNYEVLPIKGKGFGCIAIKDIIKGTLILEEKSQCNANEDVDFGSQEHIMSVEESFLQMSLENQNEYLNLFNRYSHGYV